MLERFAREKPLTTIMLAIGTGLLGAIALFLIPVTLGHGIEYPGLTVEVTYSGVTPDKIEEIITRPIEDAVATVGGIEELFSVSEEGKTKVNIQFNQGANVNLKALEVRERIDIVASSFPREAQKPVILRYDPDQRPVLIIILESPKKDLSELREIADRQIAKQLSSIQGVSQVNVAGGRMREVLVDCDRQRLQSYALSMRDLFQALQKVNLNVAAGSIDDGGGRYKIYVKGRFNSVNEIKETVIFSSGRNAMIRLSDVADVSYAFREQDSASRVDGEERIGIYVYRASRANLLDISAQVYKLLDSLVLPDVNYVIIYDQAGRVRSTLQTFLIFLILGCVLSCIAMRQISGIRGRVVVLLLSTSSIASLSSVFVLYMMGMDLNLLSISGLILAFGISLGLLAATGLIASGNERGPTIKIVVFVGVLLICATFLPVVFSSRESRLVYGGLAASIIFAIVPGFLLMLSVVPNLREKLNRSAALHVLLGGIAGRLVSVRTPRLRSFTRWLRRHVRRVAVLSRVRPLGTDWVTAIINRCIRFVDARYTVSAFAYLVFSAAGLFLLLGIPQEFGSPLEENEVRINVEFPSGTSFAVTDSTTRKVEEKLKGVKGIKQINAKVESSQSTLLVRLEGGQTADGAYIDFLRSTIGTIEPAFIYFASSAQGSAIREVTIDCFGPDLDTLDKITRSLAKRTEGFDGVRDVVLRYKSPRPELQVVVDKLKAEKAGITSREVGEMVRYAIQGGVATKFIDQTRELDVRIRYKEMYRDNPDSINEISLRTLEKLFIPLKEVAILRESLVPVKIYRKDKKRVFSYSFRPNDADYSAVMDIVDQLRKYELPQNYRISMSRDFEKIQETRSQFTRIGAIAIVLIYMIIAAFFESTTKPLLVIAVLAAPLIVAGLILRIFGIALTVPGLAAFLILAAFTAVLAMQVLKLQETEGGSSPEVSAYMASGIRPLLIGYMATLCFFLPFLFASGEGRSLLIGATVIMVSGLPVALIFTPVLILGLVRNAGDGRNWRTVLETAVGWCLKTQWGHVVFRWKGLRSASQENVNNS
ncbi:MAG: efflux RND transporter permease subunit [Leptospirales bacterium]|nr:efflux RND transporter permease subunit [Leptospirales bacterium]